MIHSGTKIFHVIWSKSNSGKRFLVCFIVGLSGVLVYGIVWVRYAEMHIYPVLSDQDMWTSKSSRVFCKLSK